MQESTIPYCGSPPLPGHVLWNTDPTLVGALLGVAAFYAWGARGASRNTQLMFYSGWLVAALALISPLCNLSVALFSARVTQHMVLVLVAAPLVAIGEPGRLFGWLPGRARLAEMLGESAATWLAAGLFALVFWFWHMPGVYDATLRGDLAYWAMHVSVFGSAVILWIVLLRVSGAALLAAFFTGVQMGGLGAILTFAAQPLFAVHMGTTTPWGFSPLEDQQLGGLIMWVPGGVLLTGYALVGFGLWLRGLGDQASAYPAPAE